jgi:hypothetical protein
VSQDEERGVPKCIQPTSRPDHALKSASVTALGANPVVSGVVGEPRPGERREHRDRHEHPCRCGAPSSRDLEQFHYGRRRPSQP